MIIKWLLSPTKLPPSPPWWLVIVVCGGIGILRWLFEG